QPGLGALTELVAETRDAGTPVDLVNRTTHADELPDTLGRTAYRVVQEGLTNARKHAPGQPVRLVLDGEPGDRLTVELTNPVDSANTDRPAARGGGPAAADGPATWAGGDARGATAQEGLRSPDGPARNGGGPGTGLIGLAERPRLTGGELDHGVGLDQRFRLRATLPWPADSAA